jgi:hypothetical protein
MISFDESENKRAQGGGAAIRLNRFVHFTEQSILELPNFNLSRLSRHAVVFRFLGESSGIGKLAGVRTFGQYSCWEIISAVS